MPRKYRTPNNPLQTLALEELAVVFPPENEAAAAHPLVRGFNKLPGNKQAQLIIFRGIGLNEVPSYDEIVEDYGMPKGSIGPTKNRVCKDLIKLALAADWDPYAAQRTLEGSLDNVQALEPPHDISIYGEAS